MSIVGRFIFRKANVPIDAQNAVFGFDINGFVPGHFINERCDKVSKWLFDTAFVALLLTMKPVFVVVLTELLKEGKKIVCKVLHGTSFENVGVSVFSGQNG